MSISVPESVGSFKSWRDNLRRNQDKMVSQFDVHQTMLHFMTSNVTTRDKDHERLPLSLLDSVIPDNRTCRQVYKENILIASFSFFERVYAKTCCDPKIFFIFEMGTFLRDEHFFWTLFITSINGQLH